MAFPLFSSSFVISRNKLSFISQKSTQKRHFLSPHFAFGLRGARSQVTARPAGHANLHCDFRMATLSKDLEHWLDFPTKIPTFGDGIKNLRYISPEKAVLYSPDTKVPRTGELALRRAIPANTNMKSIQTSLEDISYLLRIPERKPNGTMEGNVKKALMIAMDEKDSILASIPTDFKEKGSTLYVSLIDGKGGLQALLQSIKDQDPEKVSVGLASSLDTLAELELLQAPGLSFLLPEQYLKYPRLTGRGTVEFTIEKEDGSTFSPEAESLRERTNIF